MHRWAKIINGIRTNEKIISPQRKKDKYIKRQIKEFNSYQYAKLNLFPGTYTLDELADEITNTFNEQYPSGNFSYLNYSSAFTIIGNTDFLPSIWTWKWNYNKLTNKFEAVGLGKSGIGLVGERLFMPEFSEIIDNPSGYNHIEGNISTPFEQNIFHSNC